MELSFTVVHWRGEENNVADGLSRLFAIEAEHLGLKTPSPEEKDTMLGVFHSEGHGGIKQMIAKITDAGFWWSNMRDDVATFLGACNECLRFNVIQEGFHPMQPIIATQPMQHTQADLICGVPGSAEGHVYILVYMCLVSRFIWLFALKDKKAETIAECIM